MRYVVVEGSESGHCCFEATVMDLQTDTGIAECFSKEDAESVAEALNQKDHLDRIVANAKRAIRDIQSEDKRKEDFDGPKYSVSWPTVPHRQ